MYRHANLAKQISLMPGFHSFLKARDIRQYTIGFQHVRIVGSLCDERTLTDEEERLQPFAFSVEAAANADRLEVEALILEQYARMTALAAEYDEAVARANACQRIDNFQSGYDRYVDFQ
jgi:hypothetical protein